MNYIEKINHLPLINLETLHLNNLKNKKGKVTIPNPQLNSYHANNLTDMKVSSPFYVKDKCQNKNSCKCPYHKKERVKMIVPIKNHSYHTK